MKLTVLVDNNTIIDRYFLGEPGVSYLINTDGKTILFDTGYSDIFIKNAQRMNIDLLSVDTLVFSHGHNDHTWGVAEFIRLRSEAQSEGKSGEKPDLIAHPRTFDKKIIDGNSIGSFFPKDSFSSYFHLRLTEQPLWITNKLVFLGEIHRNNDFEAQRPIGKCIDKTEQDDYLLDDSALAYKAKDGLIIVTGCSHAGICNIIEQAKKVCQEDRILDIIGGFHLLNPSERQLERTIDYFKTLHPDKVHAAHCTDFASKVKLSEVVKIEEVGVGLTLQYE